MLDLGVKKAWADSWALIVFLRQPHVAHPSVCEPLRVGQNKCAPHCSASAACEPTSTQVLAHAPFAGRRFGLFGRPSQSVSAVLSSSVQSPPGMLGCLGCLRPLRSSDAVSGTVCGCRSTCGAGNIMRRQQRRAVLAAHRGAITLPVVLEESFVFRSHADERVSSQCSRCSMLMP